MMWCNKEFDASTIPLMVLLEVSQKNISIGHELEMMLVQDVILKAWRFSLRLSLLCCFIVSWYTRMGWQRMIKEKKTTQNEGNWGLFSLLSLVFHKRVFMMGEWDIKFSLSLPMREWKRSLSVFLADTPHPLLVPDVVYKLHCHQLKKINRASIFLSYSYLSFF